MGSEGKASKKKTPKKSPDTAVSQSASASIEKVGSIQFPISEAFRFSLESIRKRFTRALITTLSVLLGIAFLVTLLTMGTILTATEREAPAAYQFWMVMIALLVCGVGIINSMLMSVTERYKEIGTIKCLGATDTNVLQIFLIEALLLGLIGGVIGAIVGWVAAIIIFGIQFGWAAVFGTAAAIAQYFLYIGEAIGIAGLLSVAAAAYPAYYAARLHPAEALRYEV